MKEIYKKDKMSFYLLLIGIVVMVAMVVGVTFAYFQAQGGESVTRDVRLRTHTTDLLEFVIDNDIEFEVTQEDFAPGVGNAWGSTGARAILTPNSGSGEATEYYNMYLDIDVNDIVYSNTNTNQDPELMLQLYKKGEYWCGIITDNQSNSCDWGYSFESEEACLNNNIIDSNTNFTCEEADQVQWLVPSLGNLTESKGVVGYDITEISSSITLLSNYEIAATNYTTATDEWEIVITMINQDFDQQDNAGYSVEASIVMEKVPSNVLYTNGTSLIGRHSLLSRVSNQEVYCPNDFEYHATNECDYGTYYTSMEECQNAVSEISDTYICSSETRSFPGLLDATRNVNDIREEGSVYVKHIIDSTSVVDSQICTYVNNIELCIGRDYWDTDKATTLEKLENDVMNISNIENIDCDTSGYDIVNCSFYVPNDDKEIYINISNNGSTITINDDNLACGLIRKNNFYDGGGSFCQYVDEPESGLYHHDLNFAFSAYDDSYRYYGPNPNNYICFGSNAATCPAENIYRIIGQMPVEVVTDSTTSPETTEVQLLYKIIKNDYLTSTELNVGTVSNVSKADPYNGPIENQPSGNVHGFRWDGGNSTNYTTSYVNTEYLNGTFLSNIDSSWSSKIASVKWSGWRLNSTYYVTGADGYTPVNRVYNDEQHFNSNNFVGKIGLLNLSDYAFAVPSYYWFNGRLMDYNNYASQNWLYRGVSEWTITATDSPNVGNYSFIISTNGSIGLKKVKENLGIRPTFYLTQSTVIDKNTHAGTISDPFRITN